ncbi:glutathione S-transferase [Hypoxylon argillaceum]|nr:glutathione S-transferase [Hypoxylon argillaceum]
MATNPPKPIKVWLTPPGPNPWKVVWLIEELGLKYKIESFRFDDIKKEPFINVNPNGRVPAIEDPNTGLTLWESGAICQYLVEVYDTENRLSYVSLNDRHLCNQWLHFQMSGQGPYYGQVGWFAHLNKEKIPSAIARYSNEAKRVLGVLETVLSKKPDDAQWLVGNKMTFADMAFVPWNSRLSELLSQPWEEIWEGIPHVKAWHERMAELPSWKRSMQRRGDLMAGQDLEWNGVPKGLKDFNDYTEKIATGEDTTANKSR